MKTRLLKAAVIGVAASTLMYLFGQALMSTPVAPYDIPPSGVFTKWLGLGAQPAGFILDLVYGAGAAVALVALVKSKLTRRHGVALGGALWFALMTFIGPVIGWGLFGLMANHAYEPDIAINDPLPYVFATLVLHLFYGLVVAELAQFWLHRTGHEPHREASMSQQRLSPGEAR